METTKFLVGKLLYRFGAGFITFTFEEVEGIECREYFAVPQGDVYKKHYVGQVWSGGYKMVVGKQLPERALKRSLLEHTYRHILRRISMGYDFAQFKNLVEKELNAL